MAKSLEEAQAKYRAADKELLAARKAFEECPWADREQRVETWKRLRIAEATYRSAMIEYSPWITGNRPDIKIVG
jgi:hypothetical protein